MPSESWANTLQSRPLEVKYSNSPGDALYAKVPDENNPRPT